MAWHETGSRAGKATVKVPGCIDSIFQSHYVNSSSFLRNAVQCSINCCHTHSLYQLTDAPLLGTAWFPQIINAPSLHGHGWQMRQLTPACCMLHSQAIIANTATVYCEKTKYWQSAYFILLYNGEIGWQPYWVTNINLALFNTAALIMEGNCTNNWSSCCKVEENIGWECPSWWCWQESLHHPLGWGPP